jgi:hypothetical protein
MFWYLRGLWWEIFKRPKETALFFSFVDFINDLHDCFVYSLKSILFGTKCKEKDLKRVLKKKKRRLM